MAIKECCNTGAARCTQDTPLPEVAGLMRHHKIRRMPTVTAACTLDGVVTPDDHTHVLARELSLMTAAATDQFARKASCAGNSTAACNSV